MFKLVIKCREVDTSAVTSIIRMQPDQISLRAKVGQMFFIGIPGPELDDPTRQLLDEVEPGGICLFARNIKSAEQTRELLDSITAHLPIAPALSLDQEGGLVDRLRRIIEPMPSAGSFKSLEEVKLFAEIIAESVRMLGFNMNFAPVADVAGGQENTKNGLYSRIFGTNAAETTKFATAFLKSMQGAGLVGCLKHFPGLASASVDSHEELPVVEIDDDTLHSQDLLPYQTIFQNVQVHAVMTAHAVFPNTHLQDCDESGKLLPASLSPNVVTGLLKQEFGFAGVAITDDLEMGAIKRNYGMGEACIKAVAAGADMLAICADPKAIHEGFSTVLNEAEAGIIPETRIDDAVARIVKLKSALKPSPALALSRLEELSEAVRELKTRLNN